MNTYTKKNDELYHYGVKGMKWGVRRYQKKDGSLTSAGKKQIRKDLEDANIAKKYKAMTDADRKHGDTIDKIFQNKPADYKETKKDKQTLDKSFKEFEQKSNDYSKTINDVTNNFLKMYGNKRISEVNTVVNDGREAVKKLLKENASVWNENIETVRRHNAYEDLKRLQDNNLSDGVHEQIEKIYKKQYGVDISPSSVIKKRNKKYVKDLKKRVKNNKKNGYY